MPFGASHWTGNVKFLPEKLDAPLRWKRPRRVFVNSMSDLFHESLPFEDIAKVFAVMQLAQHHEFQVLTKRAGRMLEFYRWLESPDGKAVWLKAVVGVPDGGKESWSTQWPFLNVHLGVSCENQAAADERIPLLLQCPAAVRWVSYEPALGQLEISDALGLWNGKPVDGYCGGCRIYGDFNHTGPCECRKLDWVVCGGESGPHARPMHPDWARSIRDQCKASGVPFHFKQHGEFVSVYDRDADDPDWRNCDTIAKDHAPGQWLNLEGGMGFHGERVQWMKRVGKKHAGHLLDGREYRMWPGDKW